jgi:hypothetical protein
MQHTLEGQKKNTESIRAGDAKAGLEERLASAIGYDGHQYIMDCAIRHQTKVSAAMHDDTNGPREQRSRHADNLRHAQQFG